MPDTLFPTSALQALTASIHFLGVTILTVFFSRRLLGDGLTTRQAWSRLTWPRICILLVFLDSYLFLFSSAILIFGVGLQMNETACATGIYICVLFYASSKVLIYAFLTEKVYIVWDTGRKRMRSPVYLVCMGTVLLYAAVIIIMIIGRVDEFRPGDGVIGLKPTASIPLLSYDLYINLLLTGLFLWPLLRSQHSNAQLRRVATRTLAAAGMALTTSTVNITVLTIMKGHQLGWLCLSSCGMDVIFNATVLFWVTTGSSQSSLSGSSANRHLSDVPVNGLSFSVPSSPARGTFKPENKGNNMFKMSPLSPVKNDFQLSPLKKEFQIHVTTQSHVSTSPPSTGPSLSNLSETDSKGPSLSETDSAQ
ncbi:hypothetical protein B0H19DRAFT_1275837 [Mycena capillaripes]|nr:hypothetical protein B0H19DRAFT_1275837 [Mycena capillaripes]